MVDVAYRLRLDHWQGQERLQLEIIALRVQDDEAVMVHHRGRRYRCWLNAQTVHIRNAQGLEMTFSTPGGGRAQSEQDHPYLLELQGLAQTALGLRV
jgi:single-stranded-DNA-specific exonuclease